MASTNTLEYDTSWQEYEIDGSALNLDNWHKTEKHVEIPIEEAEGESEAPLSSDPNHSSDSSQP